ncbi:MULTISPECIES: hypothetical protein [unclassified Mesorhizobium]|uniref:hypothetical protein n=1 Tax=unclassified Mesorhizobium TaxID=325217 RepID=UPI000FDB0FA7|nr:MULTISPECIES: hypothetical protein [unclassified Mesorhizobium]TGT76194.1 hypothetical protein EN809_000790 [Mesorhizobium sp. M2E.F.Ca.ET.166.01.1.1]TGW02309.1 hypothetical protein EN797_000790 [Mesorhizobium sp. M2E.F.Ca.ET.154.01.1.1]
MRMLGENDLPPELAAIVKNWVGSSAMVTTGLPSGGSAGVVACTMVHSEADITPAAFELFLCSSGVVLKKHTGALILLSTDQTKAITKHLADAFEIVNSVFKETDGVLALLSAEAGGNG